MKTDKGIATIFGGRCLVGTVEISGSKHSAMHILGAALLAGGKVVIDDFPQIEDALNFLRIYQSLGVDFEIQGKSAVLNVTPANITMSDAALHLVPRLRSSILLLGSFLLRNRYIKMPIPGGDKIDPGGKRDVDEFVAVLDQFGIRCRIHPDCIEAWLDCDLEGDKEVDLGDYRRFWFRTGNTRTALALILAAGNRGRTTIHSALCAAEINQLGEFLLSIGCEIHGLGTATVLVQSKGLNASPSELSRVSLYPDKCEIAFWIVAACLTRGNLVLLLPASLRGCSPDNMGPLYRIRDEILAPMNIPLDQISDCEFRIDATRRRFFGMDLILDHLETEFNGKVMDACPYFIPLMCVAEGKSRYLDGKFGGSRVAFCNELKQLGVDVYVDTAGMAHISGGQSFRGSGVWCQAADIRGAGSLLLALLATEGENHLAGIDAVRRANDYLPKLVQLGCRIETVEDGGRNDLALAREFRLRKITLLHSGGLAADYVGRPPIILQEGVSLPEVVASAFMHPDQCGAGSTSDLLAQLSGAPWKSLEMTCGSTRQVEAAIARQDGTIASIILPRNPPRALPYAPLGEYVEIAVGGKGYFAGRCLSPVGFEEWHARIADVIAHPTRTWIPLTVTLGITDRCNLDCGFCFARGLERSYSLSRSALLRLINEMADAGVRAVRFVGRGEATIHPDFIEALLTAKGRGLGTFLITNGSTLPLFSEILAASLDSIRISANCGMASSDSVASAIRRLAALRLASGRKKSMLVGASYVVTADNIAGIMDSAQALKGAGADYVLFKKAHGNDWSEQAKWDAEQALHSLAPLSDDSFRIIPELFDYEEPGLEASYYQGPAGCILHHLRAVVEANGDVFTCHQKGNASFARLGNIHRSSFAEIMHGDERRKALERRSRIGTVCPGCLFKDAHLLISRLLAAS